MLVGAAAGCTTLAVAVPVGAAGAQQTDAPPPIVVDNGLTQPVYAFTQAVEQAVVGRDPPRHRQRRAPRPGRRQRVRPGRPRPPGSRSRSWTYQTTVHRWFDHGLWGVDNGIMQGAARDRAARGQQRQPHLRDWPLPGSRDTTLRLTAADATTPGTLASVTAAPGRSVAQSFGDNGRNRTAANLLAGPDAADPNRLVYVSDALESPVHLSGTPSMRLRASVDNAPAANLTAYLVDYGPPGSASATMVTRGWTDVQNRVRRDKTDPIQPGQMYGFRWDLHADDYVFQAGRRIGVVRSPPTATSPSARCRVRR